MLQPPTAFKELTEVETFLLGWFQVFADLIPFKEILFGSETKNWGSIADHQEAAEEVTVTGAALGDFAIASMSVDVGAIDLGSGTLSVMVFKAHK